MSQVVHGEEETSRHRVPIRRVIHDAGVVANADLFQVLLQLVWRQQFGSRRVIWPVANLSIARYLAPGMWAAR